MKYICFFVFLSLLSVDTTSAMSGFMLDPFAQETFTRGLQEQEQEIQRRQELARREREDAQLALLIYQDELRRIRNQRRRPRRPLPLPVIRDAPPAYEESTSPPPDYSEGDYTFETSISLEQNNRAESSRVVSYIAQEEQELRAPHILPDAFFDKPAITSGFSARGNYTVLENGDIYKNYFRYPYKIGEKVTAATAIAQRNILAVAPLAGTDRICLVNTNEPPNSPEGKIFFRCTRRGNNNHHISQLEATSETILAGTNYGKIHLFDLKKMKATNAIKNAHKGKITALACLARQRIFVSSGQEDKQLKIWDLRNVRKPALKLTNSLSTGNNYVVSCTIKEDNYKILTATENGMIQLWDPRRNNQPLFFLDENLGKVKTVDWSPVCNLFATGSQEGTVCFYNDRTYEKTACIEHDAPIVSCSFAPYERKILVTTQGIYPPFPPSKKTKNFTYNLC